MATSTTIPTARRDPFKGNLTLGSPFEQPGTNQAAPVPENIIDVLRSLTMQAPSNEGIIGTTQANGTPMLTNRPETARGMDDHSAYAAFEDQTWKGDPQARLADFIGGARNTSRANKLNRAADEAFDIQQAQHRVTGAARDFERGHKSADTIADALAQGEGQTGAFLTPGARDMREETGRAEMGLAREKNVGPLAAADADMYAADREARAREAAVPGQRIGAYADVLGASNEMMIGEGDTASQALRQRMRQQAERGITEASGGQVATESDILDYAERTGRDPEAVRELAMARGFVIVP